MTYVLGRRGVLAMILAALAVGPARAQQSIARVEPFKTAKLAIQSASGRHDFTVELALTEPQMERGLMFRQTMAADAGMLFDYGAPSQITMWMKNTVIPLDMIFIGDDLRVVGVHERAVPQSTAIISVGVPSRYVLEVPGGWASRVGIANGTRVELHGVGPP